VRPLIYAVHVTGGKFCYSSGNFCRWYKFIKQTLLELKNSIMK